MRVVLFMDILMNLSLKRLNRLADKEAKKMASGAYDDDGSDYQKWVHECGYSSPQELVEDQIRRFEEENDGRRTPADMFAEWGFKFK